MGCLLCAPVSKKRPGVIAQMGEKEQESCTRDIRNCSVPSVHSPPPPSGILEKTVPQDAFLNQNSRRWGWRWGRDKFHLALELDLKANR